jgi:hypothetical protein
MRVKRIAFPLISVVWWIGVCSIFVWIKTPLDITRVSSWLALGLMK